MEKEIKKTNSEMNTEEVFTTEGQLNDLQVEKLDKKHRKFGRESLNNDALVALTSKKNGDVVAFVPKEYVQHIANALRISSNDLDKK